LIESVPAGRELVVTLAAPPLRVDEAKLVLPEKNVTVPVGAGLNPTVLIVARKVTGEPLAAVLLLAARATVVVALLTVCPKEGEFPAA
jgi:hypothetical protein